MIRVTNRSDDLNKSVQKMGTNIKMMRIHQKKMEHFERFSQDMRAALMRGNHYNTYSQGA